MLDLTQAVIVAGVAYWLGQRKDLAKVIRDKRAELISKFITKAYEGQGLLRHVPLHKDLGTHKAALAILARELAFYTSKRTGKAVDGVADLFSQAVAARVDQDNPAMHGQGMSTRINRYLPAVDAIHQTLRRELGIDTVSERFSAWRDRRRIQRAKAKVLPKGEQDG